MPNIVSHKEEAGNCSHPHLHRWGVLAKLKQFLIMREINRVIEITLIFTLIGSFLSSNLAYPLNVSHLRVPITDKDRQKESFLNALMACFLCQLQVIHSSVINADFSARFVVLLYRR
jgi:hypothetical protein